MKARKVRSNKAPVTPRPKRWAGGSQTVSVRLGGLGARVQQLKIPSETTVKDLVLARRLEKLSIRINGRPVRLSDRLRDGDLIVAMPRFVGGASGGEHDHLNLDECRRTMSPRDFDFLVNFVGADRLGFKDEDLDPC